MIKFLIDKDDLYYKILTDAIEDELEGIKFGYISAIKDIFGADLVIASGSGDFHTGLFRTITILRKPLILYHVPPDNRFIKKARWVVTSRDVSGYDYFPSPVLISDLATPRNIERIWNRERLVSKRGCIGIIGLDLEEGQQQRLTDALNLLIEDLDLNVVFIPILKDQSVRDITIRYSANIRHVQTNKYSSKEILGIISRVDMLITASEKGAVCAMAADRPVVGLAANDELDQLLGGIGEEEALFDIDRLSSNELYSKIKIAWVHRDSIARETEKKSAGFKKQAQEGVRRLAKWIRPS